MLSVRLRTKWFWVESSCINVGIMTFDGRQSLKRVRGAWDSIAIEPEADIV